MGERKTLEDINAMTCDMLTPAVVGDILRCDPHYIREQARNFPELLGFPTCLIGSRVKIPRVAFIKWCEGTDGSVAFIKLTDDKVDGLRKGAVKNYEFGIVKGKIDVDKYLRQDLTASFK